MLAPPSLNSIKKEAKKYTQRKEIMVRKHFMSFTGKNTFSLPLMVIMMALLLSTGALAQQPASTAEPWQFGLSIYAYLPQISGTTSFTPSSGGSDFNIDIDNILDNLEFVLMGTFDMRKGRWGILTDLIYMDVSGSQTGTREATIGRKELPVNASANINLDIKSWIWTITGYYRALDQPGMTLDVVAGGRYLDVEQNANWAITGNVGSIPLPDRTGAAAPDLSIWDAIIGVRGRYAFGTKNAWFMPYYLDIGAGESDFTWQGIVGLGYAFHWGDIVAFWRYLDYNMPSDEIIEDMSLNGPGIGVTFSW